MMKFLREKSFAKKISRAMEGFRTKLVPQIATPAKMIKETIIKGTFGRDFIVKRR